MARGWESKSVEAQIEEPKSPTKPDTRNAPTPEEQTRQRKIAELRLSRSRVAQQMEVSTNERYSTMLQQALADLDRQLDALQP